MPQTGRIALLDELRGACLVLMIVFHAFYTGARLFHLPWAATLLRLFTPLEPPVAGVFILLCGICCSFSRSNLRRGVRLAVVAVGLSAFLYVVMPQQMIWFGILHCLAVCLLLYSALCPLLKRIPAPVGVAVCVVLTALTWCFPFNRGGCFGIPPFAIAWPQEWQRMWWLAPLGIGRISSADYFPLLPWFFCFLTGAFLGGPISRLPDSLRRVHVKPLSFLGRHSLIVYLVHQPVIYACFWAISAITSSLL